MLASLAAAMQVSVAWLATGEGEMRIAPVGHGRHGGHIDEIAREVGDATKIVQDAAVRCGQSYDDLPSLIRTLVFRYKISPSDVDHIINAFADWKKTK